MNPTLFLSLVIILTAALPWWPYSAYGRSRHRHLLLSTTMLMRPRFSISQTRHRATPEASQKAAMKLSDGKSKTHLMRAMHRY